MKRSTAAERRARALAESIDAAAAELLVTGPVPPAVVARVMAELEDEWSRTARVGDQRRPGR
ncbi:hypothetical protein HL658_32305 [Azospirillum sp. RWY-5-1]|uniref:Uncharacterized protein n=1 Tax=Azospirillum oleiclasticum TaxID=2735135 RepID=A0ABX2TK30_9PROT|nr:hypothetical protein [Azospirillum oleiclasticum]NYZ17253.1 hypothetical protein [Azospirillum oleiclasticum]NYZ23463.1 hypothetical protein [Azospirillum oleiclasticum]